jgi:hypothetical protein
MGNYWLMRIQANVIRKHKKFIESMNWRGYDAH